MEYGQRFLIERDESFRQDLVQLDACDCLESQYGCNSGGVSSFPFGGGKSPQIHSIRFQVVIWNIGRLDISSGSVPMTFRVSLFWNDVPQKSCHSSCDSSCDDKDKAHGEEDKSHSAHNDGRCVHYIMHGREKAVPQQQNGKSDDDHFHHQHIDVPPLSILNVATFTAIGNPEVDMLDSSSRLMRWTCMYRATVVQDRLSVDQFPHDCHEIAIQLAILSHRRAGQRWDRRFWRLELATAQDSKSSAQAPRTPHGLVVDSVRIPDFHYNRQQGLKFRFCSQQDGAFDGRSSVCAVSDVYLHVSLMVLRESGYYDRNIVPLLTFLNVIAALVTMILDPEKFFNRALLILNIAFNQIGIRLAVDKHLPSVGYEIRMQRILNEFFFVLLALIVESGAVYAMEFYGWVATVRPLIWLDAIAAILALTHNGYSVYSYYQAQQRARKNYQEGILEEESHDRFSTMRPQFV